MGRLSSIGTTPPAFHSMTPTIWAARASPMTATAQVTINVTFTQVWDSGTNRRIDANYHYASTPGGDGLFQFSTYQNTQAGGIQRFAIESRWKNNGAGRSDVIVTGGALSQP